MKLSKRELILAAITFFVLLFGGTYWFGEPKWKEWQDAGAARAQYDNEKRESEQLLARKEQWEKDLEGLRGSLPKYAPDQPVSTELLQMISKSAESQGLSLGSRKVEKESDAGDVSELAINCSWEGDLGALVHFLYDVQVKGAILDIRQLTVSPTQREANRLKGNFTVHCAFTRDGAATAAPESGRKTTRGKKERKS